MIIIMDEYKNPQLYVKYRNVLLYFNTYCTFFVNIDFRTQNKFQYSRYKQDLVGGLRTMTLDRF